MKQILLSSIIILLVAVTCFGQQPNVPPAVTIINPLNGSIVDGKQTLITYVVSEATPKSVKISVDGKSVQLIIDAQLGENTATVDIPEKDCSIAIVAQNDFGAGEPATVNLRRSGNIFKPTLYVLAIGVSNYNNRDLQLQFPAKDASDFTQAMLRQAGLLYERVELKLLADRSATEMNIRDGLNWLQKQTTNRDIAMLFMAGHGINNNAGEFYFMPVNADLERINATCVGYKEIKNTISIVPGKLLVFMDACHSGNVFGDSDQSRTASISDAVNEIASASNAPVVYTSSTEAQYSLESTEWNNGAFTKALIEGLLGKADLRGTSTITIKSLDYYIAQRVKELTQGKQAPTTIIPQSVSDFPVAVVTDNMAAPTAKTKAITFAIDDIATQKYTGKPVTPALIVRDGDRMLTADADYTVTYSENVKSGTVSVAVSGAGEYAGSAGNATFIIRKPRELIVGVNAGASSFGDISFININNGYRNIVGADAAWFMNRYLGIGAKLDMEMSEIKLTDATYDEQLLFAGPALFFRLTNKKRLAFTAGAGVGALNWSWNFATSDSDKKEASVKSFGGFFTAGVNFMATQHIGFSVNMQTITGKPTYDNYVRKPAGIGATVGVNFRY